MKAGANKEEKTNKGNTPLHWAAYYDHTAVAAALMKAGANKEEKTNKGNTPLHWAAYYDHTAVAAALMKAGANKEEKNNRGNTPLRLAAKKNNPEEHADIVTLLIAYGADKTTLSEEEQTKYKDAIIKGKALRTSNTEKYKSAIEGAAKELAKKLKLKKKDIPDEILLNIMDFAVKPSDPHNLKNEERSELVLDSISRSRSGNIEVAKVAEAEERAAVDSNQIPSYAERVYAERAQQSQNRYCTIS